MKPIRIQDFLKTISTEKLILAIKKSRLKPHTKFIGAIGTELYIERRWRLIKPNSLDYRTAIALRSCKTPCDKCGSDSTTVEFCWRCGYYLILPE